MNEKRFEPNAPTNGLLHPVNCACVKCAAGRDSQELGEGLRERLRQMFDDVFLDAVRGNILGGLNMLGQNQPLHVVRSGFHGNMGHIMQMREIAASYFAVDELKD